MTKEINEYKLLLKKIPNVKKVKFEKSVQSSVTTSWGIEWSADYIARDILQNFRDGNKDNIDSIKISTNNDKIVVSADNEFDLRKLFYVGSNKKDDDIGQYGEGFKASVVSLIKMGVDNPISISGNQAVVISVGQEVKGTELRPLVYHFFTINKQKGCSFIIKTYKKELKQAFDFGLNHFWYEKNKLLGEKLSEYNDTSIYKSTSRDGYLFYCGIKRADIKDIPVIININKSYASIEHEIKSDRDRKSFSDKLQKKYFNIFAKTIDHRHKGNSQKAVYYILSKTKGLWTKGHSLLSSIGNDYHDIYDNKKIKSLFNNYYCESLMYRYYYDDNIDYEKKLVEINKIEKKWKQAGKIKLPSYFSSFGCISAKIKIEKNKENLEKRIKNKKTNDLNDKQKKAVDFCLKALKTITPSFANLYKNVSNEEGIYKLRFKSVVSKDILGQLKENREWRDKTIYLNKDLFKGSFGSMFSTFTHELAHVFGGDGEREFSDILTFILEQSIDKKSSINKFSKDWNKYKS